MIYYKAIESKEHMLYLSEIACTYGIYSINQKPHVQLVSAIIQDHIKTLNNYEQLYYNAAKGLTKVYPYSIYNIAIKKILLKNNIKNNTTNKVIINNKKFNFIWSI